MFTSKMIIKPILSFAVLIAVASCKAQNFITMSMQMQKQDNVSKKWGGESFHDLRVKLFNSHKLDFIQEADTVFFVELFELESGRHISSIWNNKSVLNYTYTKGTFTFEESRYVSPFVIDLIKLWNKDTIRKKENESPKELPQQLINATRLVKFSGRFTIDHILFKDFYK